MSASAPAVTAATYASSPMSSSLTPTAPARRGAADSVTDVVFADAIDVLVNCETDVVILG